MCGVVAVVGEPVPAASMQRALDAIARRGPDGRGAWASADGLASLGHVRLAIRDVTGGAQPLATEDGSVVAVVNGELYDATALRRELESRGHSFRTRSDSELVVHGWREWGERVVDRLRGEFAFALFDSPTRTLFCARDRFGIKPLAWSEAGGVVRVASQAAALFALGVPREWDTGALRQSASLQYAGPSATLFRGVRELPAGHTLTVRDGRATVARAWDLDTPLEPALVRDDDAVALVREGLRDAVSQRLTADVPVCAQLSGGLDSAAVLACAASAAGPIDAFTVSFEGASGYDELPHARAIAAHVGSRLHVVRVTDADVAETFADAVTSAEGLCINAHAAAKLLLSRAMRDAGFKVALTGEGADEVLFGYAHLRAELAGAESVAATNSASAGLMLPTGDGLPLDAVRAALGFVPTWLAAKAGFGARVHALCRDDVFAAPYDAGAAMIDSLDLSQLRGRGRVEQSAYAWTKLALEGYILRTLGDGLEMASSIEGRLPMLDHLLFERLRALPLHIKIRDGVEKWALRRAMTGLLPEEVLVREKHPFLAPPMGPRTLAVARDALSSRSFQHQPLLDPEKVRALLDRLPAMTDAQRKAVDPVLYFSLSIAALQAQMGAS